PPGGDRGEAPRLAEDRHRHAHGPVVEDDRRADGDPVEPGGGNGAGGAADPFSDGEVPVVAVEPGAAVAGGVPELREAGIDVDVGLAPEGAEQARVGQVAADVHEEVGATGDLGQGGPGQSLAGDPAVVAGVAAPPAVAQEPGPAG